MCSKSFNDLNLSKWILQQLLFLGIKEPTPIQENCILPILEGKDCIGAAKTGSGKTLAFALPILQKLSEDPYGIFAVILTPTRELAFQIRDNFNVVGKVINIRTCVVVGGMEMIEQSKILAGRPHIVIATPGRLSDLIDTTNTFSLKKIKFLVLDEADRLLGGAYDEHLKSIFEVLPKSKQTLLFSATMTDALLKVKDVIPGDPFMWSEDSDRATVDRLQEHYVLCPKYVKDAYLIETLRTFFEQHEGASAIIFTDTCQNCQLLSMVLNNVGFDNVHIHRMMAQKLRLSSLHKFKSKQIRLLVATDVASRGLDIPEVDLVVNHNIPPAPKDYIHRVGRTARAGKAGHAISLMTPKDVKPVLSIETATNKKLVEFKIDSKEVAKIFTQISVTRREAELKLEKEGFDEKRKINKRKQLILEGKDPDEPVKKTKFKRKKSDKGKKAKSKKMKPNR